MIVGCMIMKIKGFWNIGLYLSALALIPGIPAPVHAQERVKIAVWGDSRENLSDAVDHISDILLNRITDWDFQIHTGDFTTTGSVDDWTRSLGYPGMDSLFVRDRFLMCTSNHDAETGDLQSPDHPYNQFTAGILPTNSLDGTTHFYHFQFGRVHVIACDNYFTDRPTMNSWLEAELESVPDDDWLLGVWHEVDYEDISYKSGSLGLTEPWLDKFQLHGGDFILHGHAHTYVRSHPLLPDGTVDHDHGMVHIINGTGGASWEPAQLYSEKTAFTPDTTSFATITFITLEANTILVQTIDAPSESNLNVIDEWQAVRTELDYAPPDSVNAFGIGNSESLVFRFNELVEESTAVNTANISLSGGLTAGTIVGVNSDQWSVAAPFSTPRSLSAAGVTGGKLYLVGGYDGNSLGTLEVYDPVTDSWVLKTPMPTPRYGSAAGVIDGKLYVAGGRNGGYLNTLEIYDPVTDSWSAGGSMPTPRAGASAGVIDGKLYVAGGQAGTALASFEVFDPVTDSWAVLAPAPAAFYNAMADVHSGRLYLAGGRNDTDYLASLEVYDPVLDRWMSETPMLTARESPAGGFIDGRLFVSGGFNGGHLNSLEVYDLTGNNWTAGNTMPTARGSASGTIIEGTLYVAGGFDGGYLGSMEAFTAVPSRYSLTLSDGQRLPSPETTVVLTALNISDLRGNTSSAPLVTTFLPASGESPTITLTQPAGMQSGDIPIPYEIIDSEQNLVSLHADYSIDSGANWHTAATLGDTAAIDFGSFHGTLIWQSRSDLDRQDPGEVYFRITPRDNETRTGLADTIMIELDNKPPGWIAATGSSGDSTITFWFDEPVDGTSATDPDNVSLSGGLSIGGISGISLDSFAVQLTSGQMLPAPPATVTVSVSGIPDTFGNVITAPLDTSFAAVTGTPPGITLIDPVAALTGDAEIRYVITDTENNLISLGAEYTLEPGSGWQPATISGDTSNIASSAYEGSLTWQSGTDLTGLSLEEIWLRVTPWDDPRNPGVADTLSLSVDNNSAPVIAAIPDTTITEIETLELVLAATDPDGDDLDYSLDPLPATAVLTDSLLSWTPGYDQAGSYPLTARVTDGTDTISTGFTVIVTDVNRAPGGFSHLAPGDSSTVGSPQPTLRWHSSSDPDGDPVLYEVWFGTESTFTGIVPDTLADTTWTVNESLQEGSRYHWNIRAFDGRAGETWLSAPGLWFIVNQGPPWFAVGTLPTPLLPGTVRFYFDASEDLPEAPLITLDGAPLILEVIDSTGAPRYTARSEDLANGAHLLSITAHDGSGTDTTQTAAFSIIDLQNPGIHTLVSPDGFLTVRFPDQPVDQLIQSLIWEDTGEAGSGISTSLPGFTRTAGENPDAPERTGFQGRDDLAAGSPLAGIYRIEPVDAYLLRNVTLSWAFGAELPVGMRPSDLMVFRLDSDSLIPLPTFIDDRRGIISATTRQLGLFQVRTGNDSDTDLIEQDGLGNNFPNPFNGATSIQYWLDQASQVRIEVRNTRGQLVRLLTDRWHDMGRYQVTWDGRNGTGQMAASGIYLYRLVTDRITITRKMLLMK